MSLSVLRISFCTLLLFTGFAAGAATEQKAVAKAAASSAPPVSKNSNQKEAKPVTAAKVRLVDINSAGINELKTLPGVTDAVAQTIIAGRPFGSKAQLTTRGILGREVYEDIKTLVIARQTAETTAKLLKK
ncbi:helix-hairpin-helix domain-containing protein [Rhodoferax sp.]|uniref:ComEA family DNA-binding protein n=1 Tax=Rhodoferax sp. TaxID=50421 RepID=UPI0025D98A8B|nr:helix-hairpin-helix domain-containing protein [Rhodoferax sp.]